MMPHGTKQSRLLILTLGSCLLTIPGLALATSLTGTTPPPDSAAASPKDAAVKKYVAECRTKPPKDPACDKIRKEAVEILKDDVLTLGSSANREFLPTLLTVFKSEEPELRIAVLDAIGMIGPRDADVPMLGRLANDPVPDVRQAAFQAVLRGKGPALSLLGRRLSSGHTGRTPDIRPDAGTYGLPVAPDSVYLFYAGDVANGRLSYVGTKSDAAAAFFKGKAKRGPMPLSEFQHSYHYQLQDEHEARQHLWRQQNEARGKRLDALQKDTANPQAALDQIMQLQGDTARQLMVENADRYESDLFGSPTVMVLEERQIGSRRYPTKYVVLYQDAALKRPGYRLAWTMLPDDLIKTAQADSLISQKRDEERHKREEEGKKKQDALEETVKKKDEAEKKKFKKGQADLEKELGF